MTHLPRPAAILLALVLPALLSGCGSYDPLSAYSAEEKAKILTSTVTRQQQNQSEIQTLKGRDTVTDAMLSRALAQGGQPVRGIKSRGTDIFEGQWEVQDSPYSNAAFYEYARGTYSAGGSIISEGVYRGDFKYFPDPGEELRTGTYVMIGTHTNGKGITRKGIFVAENSIEDHPLVFYRATPDYLNRVESRYRQQIANWRAEQARQQANADSSFDFGQILALGLGGMMIATSDIPGVDKLEIGTALFQDIMTDGEANALADLTSRAAGGYLDSSIAGPAPVSGTAANASPAPAAPSQSTASATTASAGGRTASYTFTCSTGQSNTIQIPHKSEACLSAKKQMSEIYGCNLIDDFAKVASLCKSSCGSAQCME